MATWTNGKTNGYTGYLDGSTKCDGFIKVTLQYDKDSATPTSVKARFKIDSTQSSYWKSDEYFIFWKPNQKDKEQFFRVKEHNASWPDYSKTFTLTKTYNASGFSIPEYWICHTGALCNGKTVFESSNGYLNITYGDASTKTIYWYFTNNRKNFKTIVSGSTLTVSGTVATNVGKGTVSITDNGDNTFTLKGTKGANGTSNAASGPTLSWGYSSSYGASFKTNDKINLTMANVANASRTVYARSVTGAVYGPDATATTSLAVKQYVAPSQTSNVKINYSKNRLTVKENWKYTWDAATATNTSSPVKGYRIYLYKNDVNVPIVNSSGTTISSVSSQNAHYYELTGTSITINPIQNNFTAGDTVKLAVRPYTLNGKGSRLFADSVASVASTVQNAGVVHVRNGGAWAEGQVKVRVNGQWVEAQSVKVYNNGQWVEAK